MFKNIVWSENSCTLKSFVECYPLPQIVQVEDGIYSHDEAKTLSAEQVLTLHCTKRTDKVLAKGASQKEYYIPVNCPCKVKILPTFCEDMYYSVQDIVDATSVKFIRVVHDRPHLGIKVGDILKLKQTVEENHQKFIECKIYDKTQDIVRLPLEFKDAFEPLARPEEYHFQEVLHSFKLPVRVKFISSETKIQDVNNEVDLLSLDSVLLKSVQEESTIIATSRADNTVTVLILPIDLDVSVRPALGAIKGDKTYARFCRDIHDGADLEKVDLSLANSLKLSREPDVDVLYDYDELRPPVPPRCSVSSQPEDDDSDSSEGYEEVTFPRPPRPPKLTPPPTSPKPPKFTSPRTSPESPRFAPPPTSPESQLLTPPPTSPEAPLLTPPPTSPKPKPPQQSQHQGKKSQEVFNISDDNTRSTADYQVPRPPVRTLSLQTKKNLTTVDSGADKSIDGLQSEESSSLAPPPTSPKPRKLTPPATSSKLAKLTPPTVYPKPKPSQQLQRHDRELDEVSNVFHENTPTKEDYGAPRPPLQASSLQQINLATADGGADGDYDRWRSDDENSPESGDCLLPVSSDLTGTVLETYDRDGYRNSNDDFEADDSNDSSEKHEYLYPEVLPMYTENAARAPQESVNFTRKHSLRNRISDFFKKDPPKQLKSGVIKRPSDPSQETPSASFSDKQHIPASPSKSSAQNLSMDFPEDLSLLSVSEVGECLRKLNMEEHVDTFKSQLIDGQMLQELDDESIVSLGVSTIQQKRLIKFIGGWRPNVN